MWLAAARPPASATGTAFHHCFMFEVFTAFFFKFLYLALSESSLYHVGSFITAHGLSSCGLRAQ